MNLSSRINNLIAFNPYYVNGHSPCMPEGRRAGSQRDPSGGAASAFGAALPVMGRGEETNSKNLRLRAGWAGLQGPAQPAKLTRGARSLRDQSPAPALLHKGRVLFVCKEAYLDAINKSINSLMKGGNQQKAEGILRRCRMFIKIKGRKTSKFSYQAIQNVKPLAELRAQPKSKGSRRKQKSTPAPISQKRGTKSAIQ